MYTGCTYIFFLLFTLYHIFFSQIMSMLAIFLALALLVCLLYLYEPASNSWWEAIFEFDFAGALTLFPSFRYLAQHPERHFHGISHRNRARLFVLVQNCSLWDPISVVFLYLIQMHQLYLLQAECMFHFICIFLYPYVGIFMNLRVRPCFLIIDFLCMLRLAHYPCEISIMFICSLMSVPLV